MKNAFKLILGAVSTLCIFGGLIVAFGLVGMLGASDIGLKVFLVQACGGLALILVGFGGYKLLGLVE